MPLLPGASGPEPGINSIIATTFSFQQLFLHFHSVVSFGVLAYEISTVMPKRKRSDQAKGAENETPIARPKRKRNKDAKKANDDSPTQATEGQSKFESFKVASNGNDIACERRGRDSKPSLIFTHGAGGGLSGATQDFADGFAEVLSIVSFQGNMNLKSRWKSFQAVVEHEGCRPALGGRSMGARAAVLAASQPDTSIEAVVLASYPMVGAQKGDSREQILLDLPENVDVLFISGSKDSMCDMDHLQKVAKKMKAQSWIAEVQGADHGMSLKPKAGVQPIRTYQGTLAANWLLERDQSKRYCVLSWSDGKVESSGWQEGEASLVKKKTTKERARAADEDVAEPAPKKAKGRPRKATKEDQDVAEDTTKQPAKRSRKPRAPKDSKAKS
jgi:pimeloyl-ACP methyl ester carboxylesterase